MTSSRKYLAPRGVAPASIWAVLLALVGLVLGGVIIRDAVVMLNWDSGEPWILSQLSQFTSLQANDALLMVAVTLIVVAILLFVVAVLPRSYKGTPLDEAHSVWLKDSGLAAIAAAAATDEDGVLSANATATASVVSVDVEAVQGSSQTVRSGVQAHVEEALAALQKHPKITIRVSEN